MLLHNTHKINIIFDKKIGEEAKLVVSSHSNSGCRYEWCPNIPRITVVQFMVGFVLGTVGYPFCLTLSASIFSKIIGATNPVLICYF